MSETSSMVSTATGQSDSGDDEDNSRASFVVCCNIVLFIIMIILLMLFFIRYTYDETDSPSYRPVPSGGPPPTTAAKNATVTEATTPPTTPSVSTPTTATTQSPTAPTTPSSPKTTRPPQPSSPSTSLFPTTVATTPTTTPTTSRNYTLICVFEALRQNQWNKTYSCTDYVYIRFFSYSNDPSPSAQVVFESKQQHFGVQRLYYDNSEMEWRQYSYRALDTRVRNAKIRQGGGRWMLGIWGAAYIRLMNALFDAGKVQKALHDAIRSNFSQRFDMSFFDGFGIINTIICDTRPLGRAGAFSTIFRGSKEGPPILPPGWFLLHTAAVFPLGNGRIPETMVADILREADLVGLSTSNTTDEPNILQDRIQNNAAYLFASPPNPIMPPGPMTRGALDNLGDFPHWKTVLNRNRLCFSVSTSINYAWSSIDGINFVDLLRHPQDVQRYSRRRFVDFNSTAPLPVLERRDHVYYYDNVTHTHYWRYPPPGQQLMSFFAYDNAETIKYKVEQMLKAYPNDRCVVFDDLGEDALAASFTVKGVTYEWKAYAMFEAVYDVLNSV
ncbi:uncharacterized protein LOC142767178 [Rhipicephalus microplus]|uniref:uncharacterized protein LOC142767178 n=1 Tax=Rhipicephalus microplus TaxID=6941 RepID=UPI003F6AB0C4